jgi:hypothetical protein
MGRGRRRLATAAAVALSLLGAACTSGRSTAKPVPPTTTTSVAAVTTTTLDPTRAAILAAYRAHWDDVLAVSSKFPINPLDARLALHTTGKQLSSEEDALTQVNLKAHYEMGTLELNPVVTAVTENAATIMECAFDHSVEVDAHTKLPVEQPDVGHSLLRFTMTKVNESWFVSDSTILKPGRTMDACTPGAF